MSSKSLKQREFELTSDGGGRGKAPAILKSIPGQRPCLTSPASFRPLFFQQFFLSFRFNLTFFKNFISIVEVLLWTTMDR